MGNKFAYMVLGEPVRCIMYRFGKFHVVNIQKTANGLTTALVVERSYKTVRGAECYLLKHYGASGEVLYDTESFIRDGSYWK